MYCCELSVAHGRYVEDEFDPIGSTENNKKQNNDSKYGIHNYITVIIKFNNEIVNE